MARPKKSLPPKRVVEDSPKPDQESPLALEEVLLLLEDVEITPAARWYVLQLEKVYVDPKATPKTRLEILQELRDFILPIQGEPLREEGVFDPAAGGIVKMAGVG